MTDKEALEYIEEKQLYKGIRKQDGLETLCQYLGEPQKALPIIGIAGTNGRRSIIAYAAGVLSNAGYRVACYTEAVRSDRREHVRVKNRPMTKQGLYQGLEWVQKAIEQMRKDELPEPAPGAIETSIAFLYLQERKCEVVLWEVAGESGKKQLDVIPNVMAIVYTGIGADRRQYADELPEQIAAWQAKCMGRNGAVISGLQMPQVEQVLRTQAKALDCSFARVEESAIKKIKCGLEKQIFTYKRWERLELTAGGNREIEHAALAIELLDWLEGNGFIIKESAMRKGLQQTACEAGIQVVGKKPWFLMETVENEETAQAFAEALELYFPGKRKIFMMGCLHTMEYDKIIRRTCVLAAHIITVTVREDVEGMHAYELAKEVQLYHAGVTAVDSPEEAIELAYLLADKETVLVALGANGCLGSLMESAKKRNMKKPHGR